MNLDKPEFEQRLLSETRVKEADTLTLEIKVKGAHQPSVAHEYKWTHNGGEVADCKGDTLQRANVSQDDGGTYEVSVVAVGEGSDSPRSESATSITQVVVEAKAEKEPEPKVLAWDNEFARNVLLGALAILGAGWLVISIISMTKWAAWDLDTPRLAVAGLLLLAVGLGVGGAVLAILDLRGRAQIVETATQGDAQGRGLAEEAVKQLPDIIKNFGALGLASAVLLLAATAMICATVIGWRALPAPSPSPTSSTQNSTAPTSSTPAPTSPSPGDTTSTATTDNS